MTLRIVDVGCIAGGEAFLLMTEEKSAVVDAGFSFTAKPMVEKMKAELGDRPLDYILLSHSHYDHISGASEMKKEWPEAKIVSAEHAAKVFEKKNVMKTIAKLNRSAAFYFRRNPFFRCDLSKIRTDIIVKDGDVIDMGSEKVEIIGAPGHTKDSLAFWCRNEEILISCETMGVLSGDDRVMPACLVGFGCTMDFIERAERLHPKKMLYPHYGVIEGEGDCEKVISWAKRDNLELRDVILKAHREGMDVETIKQMVKDRYYTDVVRKGQPEKAFDLNNRYLVPMIIKECGE